MWSTRQLAELAGVTRKAIRYYTSLGLLEEPDRDRNDYRRYQARHLVRLLRIRRLVDLGVSLSHVQRMLDEPDRMPTALEDLELELAAKQQQITLLREEVQALRHHGAPADVPAGFGSVGSELSDTDRALLLICARVFDLEAMRDIRGILESRSPEDVEFRALDPQAGTATIGRLARARADRVQKLQAEIRWLRDPAPRLLKGVSTARIEAIAVAIAQLHNPAQQAVLAQSSALVSAREAKAPRA
ncbi:MAG: MerR family transcriptional regulator [Brachybacterium tyrofermentans]